MKDQLIAMPPVVSYLLVYILPSLNELMVLFQELPSDPGSE